jgi:hypothetical protein
MNSDTFIDDFTYSDNYLFIIQYILGKNKIVLNRLVNTKARDSNFINVKVVQMIYEKEGISFIELVRLRPVSEYNRREEY